MLNDIGQIRSYSRACSHMASMRHAGLLLALLAPLMFCCVSCGHNASCDQQFGVDIREHGKAYQAEYRYSDLKWLAENFLSLGFSKTELYNVMGEGEDPPTGSPDTTRVYYTWDVERLDEDILVVHFADGVVVGWEWASE